MNTEKTNEQTSRYSKHKFWQVTTVGQMLAVSKCAMAMFDLRQHYPVKIQAYTVYYMQGPKLAPTVRQMQVDTPFGK